MACNPKAITGNQLLDATPLVEMEALAPDFEWIEFSMRQVICEQGQHMEYAYFPVSGLCSAIVMADIDDQVEMGIIGKEGFVGAAILLMAGEAPFRFISQAPVLALRLPAAKLMAASALPEFRAVLLRSIHVFMVQAGSTILANSSYLLEERLARWILMTHDRLQTKNFPMTHEFMALMLAVRRAGVTEAIHKLESRQSIRASRGQMQILGRDCLEAQANGCYGMAEREHRRLIVPVPRH